MIRPPNRTGSWAPPGQEYFGDGCISHRIIPERVVHRALVDRAALLERKAGTRAAAGSTKEAREASRLLLVFELEISGASGGTQSISDVPGQLAVERASSSVDVPSRSRKISESARIVPVS